MLKRSFHRLKTHPSKGVRTGAGLLLVMGGIMGWLPVLGFWMLPFGIILLSVDFHWARRVRRKSEVLWGRRKQRKAQARIEK
ncbi:MAG TPA: PGPGW domain-containing protein [Gammaproteobacteria bacterium]|nr:PGPGW domain-containing protein [Gammaproteobacteria bacterium]